MLEKNALITILGSPVAYYSVFARILGGIEAGVFASQFFYWYGKGHNPEGWIYKTQDEIFQETGLTRRNQETGRKRLCHLKVLEEKRMGVPSRLFYRLNLDVLFSLLNEAFATEEQPLAPVPTPTPTHPSSVPTPRSGAPITQARNTVAVAESIPESIAATIARAGAVRATTSTAIGNQLILVDEEEDTNEDWEQISEATSHDVQNAHRTMYETRIVECANPPSYDVRNAHRRMRESAILESANPPSLHEQNAHTNTKTTAKTTAKITTETTTTTGVLSTTEPTGTPKNAVVVALTSRKIAKNVAAQLSEQFPLEHIQEKIAFHDFLTAERPTDIKKPAAWLRSAIENDYSAPDGFISVEDREVAANEEKRRLEALVAAQEERQRAIAEAERLEEQIQEQRFLWLHERYGTTEDALAFWTEVQQTVQQSVGASTYGLIEDAYILTLNGSTAKVGIPSPSNLARLAHPGTQAQLNRIAKSVAKRDIAMEFILLDDLPG